MAEFRGERGDRSVFVCVFTQVLGGKDRKLEEIIFMKKIKYITFGTLLLFLCFGISALTLTQPSKISIPGSF